MLCVGELDTGILLLQIVRQMLCLLPEVVEDRVRRQMARHLSSLLPRVRSTGEERSMLEPVGGRRWDHPFPRTGCSL
jgi:hypothetical protein